MIKINHFYRYMRQIFILSHANAVTYRADYFLRIIRSIFEVAVTYILLMSIYTHTSRLVGWTYAETLVLFAFVQIIFSLVMMWFGSIQFIFDDIRTGKLDRMLLQPMNSLFLASTRFCYITNIFRLLLGFFILLIALPQVTLTFSPLMIVATIISLVSAMYLCYALFALASIVAFWSYNNELWFLMDTLSSSLRYPVDVMSVGVRWIFYLIPVAFIATVPAKALLGKDYTLALISPLIALLVYYLLKKVWERGVRQYEGASI